MTTSTPNKQKPGIHITITTKQNARINRDKDTGWGYALAHCIPLVGVYYAFTRRTITPIAYDFIGSLIIGFTIGIASPGFVDTKEGEVGLTLLNLVATPLLVKSGIKATREEKKFGLPTED